ncbi:hypothetical protein BJ165DRAFT_777818 [Panaeolus papilionaceus]|nr:hypothetical protein BJ165DRAFT_777818 [Panaeolus papilionaceus]
MRGIKRGRSGVDRGRMQQKGKRVVRIRVGMRELMRRERSRRKERCREARARKLLSQMMHSRLPCQFLRLLRRPLREKKTSAPRSEEDLRRSTSRTRNGNGWWGIVGWGSSTTSVNVGGEERKEEKDVKVEEGGEGTKKDEAEEGKVDGEEGEGEGTVKGVPEVVQEERVEQVEKSEDVKPVEGEEKKEEVSVSVTTTEKENGVVVGSSAWFAKWTWYGAGEVGGGEETKKVEERVEVETSKVDEEPDIPAPPESEPKDEGVVVCTQDQPEPKASSPLPSKPSLFDENPLSSTMSTAAQRSIWSSIFISTYTKTISKTSDMKAIEDGRAIENVERDEHGTEIMDIESEDESPLTPASSSSPPPPIQPKSSERKSRGWAGPMRMMVSAVSSSRDASVERRQSNSTGPKSSTSSQNGNNPDITGLTATTTTNATTTTSKNMPGDSANVKEGAKGDQKVSSDSNTPTPTPTTSTASTSQSTAGSSSLTTTTLSTFTALTKRTSSPAPSTSSSNGGSSKPNGPPPPNLVLPTWEDTFFVPPRGYVEPPPPTSSPSRPASPGEESVLSKGIIGGALRLVSGVLGNPQQPPPSAPTHPSTRRRGSSQPPSPQLSSPPNPFRHFGRELPKAYQVLEEAGYDTSAPPEYSPSPAYSHLSSSPPRFSSPRSARSPSLPRNLSSSPPQSATSGFSFFGGGPKRAASPPPEMPEPAPMEEVRDLLRGCKRVVVIGVHGWFPGAMIRTVLGEPTGTSSKFANMMALALHQFELEMDVKFEKVTKVVLEGEGEVKRRVDKLYSALLSHPTHLADIHRADAILVATHSQGSVVSTHILNQLIKDGHIVTRQSLAAQIFGDTQAAEEGERRGEVLGVGGEVYPGSLSGLPSASSTPTSTSTPSSSTPVNTDGLPRSGEDLAPPLSARTTSTASAFDTSKPRKPQRVCCLAMCGIHLGPLRYLNTSGFVGPYIQYLESAAARELFEFQNTESAVSKAYVKALEGVLDAGVKMVYVASLNDQVVPIYSGLFTSVHHPSILRALYIDGDAYSTSDFLCALLVLLIRIINAGLPDSGLIAHLSEATAGSLSGIGHSAAYEELATYMLAVKYLFLVDEGAMGNFNAGSLESAAHTHDSVPSPIPPSAQAPFFLSPTFSSFSPHMHSPFSPSFSPSSSSSSLPPLPKPSMHFTPFSAHLERNDYEIPWSLRDLIAHPIISHLFYKEIEELRDKFGEWNPKTAVLRDVKRKVSPIARLGSLSGSVYGMAGGMGGYGGGGGSKL